MQYGIVLLLSARLGVKMFVRLAMMVDQIFRANLLHRWLLNPAGEKGG